MTDEKPAREIDDRPGQHWIADLFAVGVLTVGTAILLVWPALPQAARWPLGVPFLLLYPGYAFVAAVFPERCPRHSTTDIRPAEPPTFTARIALALVVSPILIAVVGLGLSTQTALRLGPSVAGLTTITLGILAVAAIRRRQLAVSVRAGLPASTLSVSGSNGQRLFLTLAVLAFAVVTVAALAVPPDGEAYSEAYLLDDSGDNASALPTNMTTGETHTLSVGIENHENERTSYDAVTLLERVDDNGTVTDREQLEEFSVDLEDGDQTVEQQPLEPTLTGESLQLQVLIYEGDRPETPTADSADQRLQLQVSVEQPADGSIPE